MSTPPQSPAYLSRLRERLTAIKQNTSSFKTRISGSIGRKAASWRGDPAALQQPRLHPLAVTLGANRRFEMYSEEEVEDESGGNMSPVRTVRAQVSPTRSDSMDPVVLGENQQSEVRQQGEARQDGNGEVVNEQERTEEGYKGYYSMNSMKMRKSRLEQMKKRCGGDGRFGTVGRARGLEIQSVLRELNAEMEEGEEGGRVLDGDEGQGEEEEGSTVREYTTRPEEQDDEEEVSSNPFPDDFPIPASDAASSRPQTDGDEDLSSNPYPDDFPIPRSPSERPQSGSGSSIQPITPSAHGSTFSIFPADRSISPISPYNAVRHQLSTSQSLLRNPSPITAEMSRTTSPIQGGRSGERTHSAEEEQRLLGSASQSYEELQSERDLRRTFLESLSPEVRRLAAAAESQSQSSPNEPILQSPIKENLEDDGVKDSSRKNGAGRRFLHSFVCRPGACTPECAGNNKATVESQQKFKLSRWLGRRKKNVVQPTSEVQELNLKREYRRRSDTPSAWRDEQEDSHAYYQPATSLTGKPVELSKMIKRAPGSLDSLRPSSPSPLRELPRRREQQAGLTTYREGPQAILNPPAQFPYSSLSDRLRETRLQDLPLRSSEEEEVRGLLSDIERDRPRGGSTPLRALERRFESQRQANEHAALRSRMRYRSGSSLRSHSSSLTVPRSFSAPGGGSGVELGRRNGEAVIAIRRASPLARSESTEDGDVRAEEEEEKEREERYEEVSR